MKIMSIAIIAIFVRIISLLFMIKTGIHAACEKINKQGMKKIKELEKYKCTLCKLQEENKLKIFLESH